MTLQKFRVLLVLALLPLLASCQRYITTRNNFRKVVSTDYQGNVISEWIAVGHVKKIKGGVEILVVEKKKPPTPHAYEGRYVIGRRVRVLAPNVAVFRTDPPDWMRQETLVVEEAGVTGFAK